MSTPKVTVLMPVYNGEKYLRAAISSILNQTFTEFEFLIIDDGSTDNSVSIIQSFSDKRIRSVRNEKNIGLISTLNKGIELANGEYIARMDCDDICLAERLEKQVKFLDENPTVCLVASHVVMISENDNVVGSWKEDMMTKTTDQIRDMLPVENCIAHPTVMMRAGIIKLFKYNEGFTKSEDWGLWLMLLSEGYGIAKLDEVLLKYRVHPASTTVMANQEGVRKKIIRFKYRYLKSKIKALKLKNTDYKVLKSLIMDSVRYFLPSFYAFAGRVYSTNPIKLIKQFTQARKVLAPGSQISHIFFFPFYQIGGAESVHASIVETVSSQKPVVLFTSASSDSSLLGKFKKSAKTLDADQLLTWPGTKNWLIKKINNTCIRNNQIHLFGCNSRFFYELLSYLNEDVKVIDLLHAFVHEYENGPEKWSLPVVDKLVKRITINRFTIENFKELYKRNNIPESLIDRIVCISNYTDEKAYERKNMGGKLKIIYVGRGTEEKRIYLIAQVAKQLAVRNIEAEVSFVGAVKNVIPEEDLPYCILRGEISDRNEMDKIYTDAHILLITSSREGFPMVIMEAMMHGVVPISTKVGGIPEHVNNENGVLINAVDSTGIVEEVVKTIESFSKNKEKLAKISMNAHNYAVSNFSKSNFVESYTKILNN